MNWARLLALRDILKVGSALFLAVKRLVVDWLFPVPHMGLLLSMWKVLRQRVVKTFHASVFFSKLLSGWIPMYWSYYHPPRSWVHTDSSNEHDGRMQLPRRFLWEHHDSDLLRWTWWAISQDASTSWCSKTLHGASLFHATLRLLKSLQLSCSDSTTNVHMFNFVLCLFDVNLELRSGCYNISRDLLVPDKPLNPKILKLLKQLETHRWLFVVRLESNEQSPRERRMVFIPQQQLRAPSDENGLSWSATVLLWDALCSADSCLVWRNVFLIWWC